MNEELYELYKNSKEFQLWPLKEETFLNIVNGTNKNDFGNETIVFNEYLNDELVGYIVLKLKDRKGVISFIFVKEEFRKQGVGSKLINRGNDFFKDRNIEEITFGAGAGSYFFPGLPKNLQSECFFRKMGFDVKDCGLVDMYQDITEWTFDNKIFEKVKDNGIVIDYSNEKVAEKIVEFAKINFPNWYDYYKSDMNRKRFDKVFYASIDNEVVGISKLWIGDCTWDLLFENNVGGGGALGVSEKHRGKGIGLAMKAWGTQKIKEKGIKYVWIGWTYAIDFYKKLGFKVWREYFKVKINI